MHGKHFAEALLGMNDCLEVIAPTHRNKFDVRQVLEFAAKTPDHPLNTRLPFISPC
jgi:hypothetical protein